MISGGAPTTSSSSGASTSLNVHDIDAQYVHRGLSAFYPDAVESQSLSLKVLDLLSLPSDRDAENRLVVLLGFDKFDYCKGLLRDRFKIAYCARLKQAQGAGEKEAIEEEMREEASGEGRKVLELLQEKGGVDTWQKDR